MVLGQVEHERKFEAPAGVSLPEPELLGASEPGQTFTLRAVYFDTPSFDLTRAGWSLRRRTGGHDAGWHLKAPRVGDGREEIALPLSPGGVPRALRSRVADVVEQRALAPVEVLTTVRTEWTLHHDGAPAALLCHDEVSVSGGGWREVEVELLPGASGEVLDAVAARLSEASFGPAGHGSKIARALSDAVAASQRPRGWEQPAGDVVLAYIAKQIGVIQALEGDVLVDAPEAVHKSRVAARRLRSALRSFAPLFDAEFVGALVPELRWFGEVLGGPRDAEVLKAGLLDALAELEASGQPVHPAVAARLASDLDARHAAAREALLREASEGRWAALHWRLMELLSLRPLRDVGLLPGEFVFDDLLNAVLAKETRRYAKALAHPDELERWHDTRKTAKALRYSYEVLAAQYGADAKASAEAWEAVTEALGDVQDTVVAYAMLDQLAGHAAQLREPSEVFAVLQQRQLAKRAARLEDGRRAVDAALCHDRSWLR